MEGTRYACFWDMAILLISWVCVSLIFCLALAGAAARLRPHATEQMEPRNGVGSERIAHPAVEQIRAQASAQVAVLS